MFHSSCRSIYHLSEPRSFPSPRPKCLGHRCSENRLVGSHCLCLPFHSSSSQGDPRNQANPLPHHCNSPKPATRDPTKTTSVNNSSQTVTQPGVLQQSPVSQPSLLVSRSGQLQEQDFSVEVSERIAAPQRSLTRTIYKLK